MSRNNTLLLDVQLDENKPAYRSGRELTGTVIVDFHGGSTFRASKFTIECLGFSEVRESSTQGNNSKRLRREHLSLKQSLLPSNKSITPRRFPFKFRLPARLPHSIECEGVGFVRYCCRAAIRLDAVADAVDAICYFSLIEEVDLNSPTIQKACMPGKQASASKVEHIGGLSGKDEVKAAIVLVKGAYVPGENVECTVSLHCAASYGVPVKSASIRLVQTVSSTVTEKVAAGGTSDSTASASNCVSSSQTIACAQIQADEQYSKHYWSARCQLHIPGAVASSQPNEPRCHCLLSVKYTVEMSASLAVASSRACTSNNELTLSCPIVLGTIPIQNESNRFHPAAIEPSLVDICKCVISGISDQNATEKRRRGRAANGLLGQLIGAGHKEKSCQRTAPPLHYEYSLYCIYYPTISLIRKARKSILKRHSFGNSLNVEGRAATSSDCREQLHVAKGTNSRSWFETPI